MKQDAQPPKLANRLLEWLIKDELQEEIFGDLEENFQIRLEKYGPQKAKNFYWYQFFNYLRPFALRKISLQNSLNMGLFRHNFLISYRSFLRFKSTFLINLLGLATGLACAILIYIWVMDEWGMDRFHSNSNRLFQIMQSEADDGEIETDEATSPLLAEALLDEIPEVEKSVSVQEDWFRRQPGIIRYQDQGRRASEFYIDGPFFEVFSYDLISGNPQNPLPNNQSVVISDEIAKQLFGSPQQAIGQSISWDQERTAGNYAISGVFKKPPKKSTRQFDLLFPLDIKSERDSMFSNWWNYNTSTYVTLKENVSPDYFNEQIKTFMMRKQTNEIDLLAIPYTSRYLYGRFENGQPLAGRMQYIRLFSLIAGFILLIACINFMNLSTAKAANRLKEIGVKKVMGADRSALIRQYFSESILLAFLALILALLLVLIFLPQFENITGKALNVGLDWKLIFGIIGITLFAGAIAGIYPALYLSSFQPIAIIRGKLQSTFGDTWIRKGLVVFQFTISTILILSVFIISEQIDYAQSKELGWNRDNIIQFEFSADNRAAYQAFTNELEAIPGVLSATGFNQNLTGEYGTTTGLSWEGKNPEEQVSFVALETGFNFIETLDIELVAGRGFQAATDFNDSKILLNESAVKKIGLENPVGKVVNLWGQNREIVGVVKDFHFASLYEDIQACFIRANPLLDKTMVKIKAGTERNTLKAIEQVYQSRVPGLAFEYKFLDDDFQKMYQAENQVASLARGFAGISIIITCLGLLGLTSFTAERRSKEICIRKVVGSSNWNIVYLLSKDFTLMVLAALLIALPIGYWVGSNWLSNFVYSIPLHAGYFIGAALLILGITWLTIGSQFFKAARMNPAVRLKRE